MWYVFIYIRICILNDDFVLMKPRGGYVFYTHIYIMILRWWDVMRTRWWLRSTTGSYGRPVIEVAYGETLIYSTKVVWVILAREEWLGCRHDASPILHIPGSTSVWAQYILFFWVFFKDIKTYMYYVFKTIRIIKGTLVVSDLVLARWGLENVFNCP